ncbi:MAG: PDZ domain-containing protein [Pyrinomonadaceae bacterium]
MNYDISGRARVLRAGLICILFFSAIVVQPQSIKPITKNGLLEALQIGGLTMGELVRQVQQRGVDFELTGEIEAELRKAGAKAELIRAVSAHRKAKNEFVKTPGVVPSTAPQPTPPRVALGLVVQDLTPALAASLKLRETRGVMVSVVEQGSLAAKAGVERKDVITAVNDVPINDTDGMRRQITRLPSGAALALTVLRDNASRQLTITSAVSKDEARAPERPAASGKGKLGLRVEPLTAEMAARLSLANAKGLIVTVVDASGPAAAAGIKINDVIEELNGQAVRTIPEVEAALAKANSNRVRIRIKRGGKPLEIELQPRT